MIVKNYVLDKILVYFKWIVVEINVEWVEKFGIFVVVVIICVKLSGIVSQFVDSVSGIYVCYSLYYICIVCGDNKDFMIQFMID